MIKFVEGRFKMRIFFRAYRSEKDLILGTNGGGPEGLLRTGGFSVFLSVVPGRVGNLKETFSVVVVEGLSSGLKPGGKRPALTSSVSMLPNKLDKLSLKSFSVEDEAAAVVVEDDLVVDSSVTSSGLNPGGKKLATSSLFRLEKSCEKNGDRNED